MTAKLPEKLPEEIVDEVEAAIKDSRPCPYCEVYDGTHTVTCEYLRHKGNVDARRNSGELDKAVTVESPVIEESTEEDKGKDSEAKNEAPKDLLERMKPKKESK